MALPKFIVFSQYQRYLRFVKEEGLIHKFFQFNAERIADPCAKFEMELASTGNGLVHLRCCYNNKYFTRQSSNSTWIVATAEKPDEDISIWSCTMFSIQPSTTGEEIFLTHVQLGQRVGLSLFPGLLPSAGSCLRVTGSGITFRVIDWETLLFLPKHVAFKGDNGKYLSPRLINGVRYLQFASDDIEDPDVRFELDMTNNGNYRIKSEQFGTFWSLATTITSRWILANSTTSSSAFSPIKINNNVIALSLPGWNSFCERITSGNITNCLSLSASTVAKSARMEVEEVVLSRRVDNVVYRLLDARIYNERALIVATAEAINKTQEPNQVELNFSYSEFTSNTWNNEVTVTAGVFSQFRFGIPVLKRGTIEISAEVTAEWQWGETRETTTEVATTYHVTVPPMRMVRVGLLATEASFDVPFSYVQRDTLTDGRVATYQTDGGVFTGLNSYNFTYEIEEEELKMSPELLHQESSPKMQGTLKDVPRSAL